MTDIRTTVVNLGLATTEWKHRPIVRAPDSQLSTIHHVACTHVQHDPQQKTERTEFVLIPTITLLTFHACVPASLIYSSAWLDQCETVLTGDV